MKCLFLVSCGRNKTDHRTRAADLYISPRFRKSRELIESIDCPWFILSAKHGLLAPDDPVDPYNKTLNTMPPEEREQWARNVQQQMDDQLPEADKVVILAGERYCENLLPYLELRYSVVEIPVRGMTPGEELRWLHDAQASDYRS